MTRRVYRPQDTLVGLRVVPVRGKSLYGQIETKVLCLGYRLIRQQKLELSPSALRDFSLKSLADLEFPRIDSMNALMDGLGNSPYGLLTSDQEEKLASDVAHLLLTEYSANGFRRSQQRKSALGNAVRWRLKPSVTGLATAMERVAGLSIAASAKVLKVSVRTISYYRAQMRSLAPALVTPTSPAAGPTVLPTPRTTSARSWYRPPPPRISAQRMAWLLAKAPPFHVCAEIEALIA